MSRSAIQFQKGLSLPEFQGLYGTEEQCEAALEKARWPDGYPGLIQSVPQGSWPELSAFGSLSRIAPSLCPKPALLQPISI
jgi:hypothetical protein